MSAFGGKADMARTLPTADRPRPPSIEPVRRLRRSYRRGWERGSLRRDHAKVVQHGKRADAIVKNMLLYSREGSGEHRPVDINALVEESLNLAWHGARAETQGF